MAIKTTVVGSYPVPQWLRGNPDRTVLRDAIMAVLKTQELAGIDLVSDGELNRFNPSHPETNGMIDYFVGQMTGIRTSFTVSEMQRFRTMPALAYRAEAAGLVVGAIEEGTLNLPRDFEFARALTRQPLKFTCTGPHMLSKVLMDRHYASTQAVCTAIGRVLKPQVAEINADVVQLDEANISGHPEDAEWALPIINLVLEGIRGQRAVHICFGNYGGQFVQKGTWKALLPFMNGLSAHHLLLEFARRGYDELETLRDLDPRIKLGIGVIDVKDNVVDPPDLIARRLEYASTILGPERITYAHPDCGLWMLQRSVADDKMRALVQGRNLFEGKK
jgi:5-methyltetrahydropteroyltriglutamate--homocysteine methyltransferase